MLNWTMKGWNSPWNLSIHSYSGHLANQKCVAMILIGYSPHIRHWMVPENHNKTIVFIWIRLNNNKIIKYAINTCFIGIKLIEGVIWPSFIICRGFCSTLLISDCELVGAFELESAECGDGEPPFKGRLELIDVGQGWISNAELTLVGIGSF